MKKLKSKAGETLVESLAAILVFTMSSIVMYTMVSTAANINMTAKKMDEQNQKHMVAVEKGLKVDENDNVVLNGSAIITFSFGGRTVANQEVDIYGGQDGTLFTYFFHTEN
jgi:hypothetical protein